MNENLQKAKEEFDADLATAKGFGSKEWHAIAVIVAIVLLIVGGAVWLW